MSFVVSQVRLSIVVFLGFLLGATSFAADESLPPAHQALLEKIQNSIVTFETQLRHREIEHGQNVPAPELGSLVEELKTTLAKDPILKNSIRSDRALKSLFIQVMNQLKHVSFAYSKRDSTYTHDFVITDRYPSRPTQIVLKKVEDFLRISNAKTTESIPFVPFDEAKESELMKQQIALVKKITEDSLATYQSMRTRLATEGPEASFSELGPVVEHLKLKLSSDDMVRRLVLENPRIAKFRALLLEELAGLSSTAPGKSYPYLSTVEAIQRSMEFFDIVQRTNDPTRSPKLYHSDRYEYYGHYLKATLPDHIIMPTLVSLGATDILKARGVPIGFIGVNTDVTWVDGFWQTPYEFWMHDINHSRRMYQFFKEKADALGISTEEFAKQSDRFMKEKLLPLISIKKKDSDLEKNKKRLIKVVLFEILHEDALAAAPDVIKSGILRPPNLITPFEKISGDVVEYVMEPGATTLAYVFRKLAHDFYDMPGARVDNIVAADFRTRENIAEAAKTIASHLGIKVRPDVLEYLVSTDQGFPADFKQTVANDIRSRPNETVALDQETALVKPDTRQLIAELFHETWQRESGYSERWKLAQVALKDGRGINDDFRIKSQEDLSRYFKEREIPLDLQRFYRFKTNPKTGKRSLYEDTRHLPYRFLAPNNQFENIKGASLAADLLEGTAEKTVRLRTIHEAVTWVENSAETMHQAWLRRNASWAKGDESYDRPWKDLSATKQSGGLNLLKIGLETISQIDSGIINATQKSLLEEAIRRVGLSVRRKAEAEVRVALAGDKIHENWQKRSGYLVRWKPIHAQLDDGTLVTTRALLERYLSERNIPRALRRHYSFVFGEGNGLPVLNEDIQALPNRYLAPEHQAENMIAGARAIEIVDRIWDKSLSFKNAAGVERWLKAGAQAVHQAVLERNVNGARENPSYNRPWSELNPRNQRHDFDHIKIGLQARFAHNPGSMSLAQRELILHALETMEHELTEKIRLHDCREGVQILNK